MLDDDDESTQIADYVLYSADRLMSETIQYNPWGMMNEGQNYIVNLLQRLVLLMTILNF